MANYYDQLAAAKAAMDKERAEFLTAEATFNQLAAEGALKGGPDVSVWNGNVDWTLVKQNWDTAIVRIADGDQIDGFWSTGRVDSLRTAALNWFPYHYGRVGSPTLNRNRNGKSEAAMAIYFAESRGWGQTGDLPLAYDLEDLNGQTYVKAARHCIDFLRTYEYVKGHKAFIYSFPSFFNQLIPQMSTEDQAYLAQHPLWVAHHDVAAPTIHPLWASLPTPYWFWQYTKTFLPHTAGITAPASGHDMNKPGVSKAKLDTLKIA